MIEKEYSNEDNIICPYCGFEDEDSWEIQSSDDDYQCPDCDEKFILEVEHATHYSTKRKECKDEKHDMKFHLAYIRYDDEDYKTNKNEYKTKRFTVNT